MERISLASEQVLFRPIPHIETRPIRDGVLRAGYSPGGSIYPGDEDDDTLHVGGFVNAELVAVATVLPEQMPFTEERNGWRLRGMATLPNYRGLGIGRQLANLCVQHSLQMGGSYLWCTARIATKRFYAGLGFVESGEAFKLPKFSDSAYVLMRMPLPIASNSSLKA